MKRARSGFTLLELLIAVTLLGLLAVGMLLAIRVGINAMDHSNSRLMANRKVAAVERILEEQAANIMPVTARCGADAGGARIAFFQGETASMRFVSSYSLQNAARGLPMILEFQVIPGENGEGVRLVENQSLYSGPLSTGATCAGAPDASGPHFQPIPIGPGSFVLADRLAYCRLSYQEPMPPPELARWIQHWIKPVLPTAIRVEMAPLDPDPSKLQLSTLTIPIYVNRLPLERYDF